MEDTNITVTFSPAAGDQTMLSKRNRLTLAALYRHPLAHNLEWLDVVPLFEALGTIETKSHNESTFTIGDEHLRMHKSHGKNLTTDEVMALRHMLTQTGWSPSANLVMEGSGPAEAAAPERPDLLAVVDHHEARVYDLDIRSADIGDHVIRPYDPHHYLHHLTHKDQSRERGQRSPEDAQFYEQIAQTLVLGGRIVLVGHGKGHSNAVHHLTEFMREHHSDTFRRLVSVTVADLSAVTQPQLLVIGRRALTV